MRRFLKRYNWKFLVSGLILALGFVAVSLIWYPAWLEQSWHSLIAFAVAVLIGAFGFVSSVKDFFKTEELTIPVPIPASPSPSHQDNAADKIVPREAPRAPADFVGREQELERILAAAEHGHASISAVQGMGGVGKTALALVAVERLQERYPDGVVFIDLKGVSDKPVTLREALEHTIRAFAPEQKMPEHLDQLEGLYCSLLAGKRALLLFDNAQDADQVRPLIPPKGCLMLVTSRKHFVLAGMATLELDRLPSEKAVELIRGIAGERAAEHEEELAELCGCLPLAVRAAASLLNKRAGLTVEELIGRLKDEKKLIQLKDDERGETVDAVLRTSYQQLPDDLRILFRGLGVFPSDFEALAAGFVLGMEGQTTEEISKAGKEKLEELGEYSLVEYDPDRKRYRLHDLCRDFALAMIAEEKQEETYQMCILRYAYYYSWVLQEAGRLYDGGKDGVIQGLAWFDRELDNIRVGHSWALEANHDEMISRYALAAVDLLRLRFHPREQIAWIQAGLEAARRRKSLVEEGIHLTSMGLAYWVLGENRKAIDCYEQALEVDKMSEGKMSSWPVLNNLGLAYADLGETRRSIEYYEQALTRSKEIHSDGEGTILYNMGIGYSSLGDHQRAVELYEQALPLVRDCGDRRGEGNTLYDLGNAYLAMGNPQQATDYYNQAMKIYQEMRDPRGEGTVLDGLGNVSLAQGDAPRAMDYYRQALKIATDGSDTRLRGNTIRYLGDAYRAKGEHPQAVDQYEQALRIAREAENRKLEAEASWALGLALLAVGDQARAFDQMDAAVKYYREIGHACVEQYEREIEEARAEK